MLSGFSTESLELNSVALSLCYCIFESNRGNELLMVHYKFMLYVI